MIVEMEGSFDPVLKIWLMCIFKIWLIMHIYIYKLDVGMDVY